MNRFRTRFAVLATISPLILSGCMTPESFETAPVQVATAQGVVTCQLYRRDRVLWDRAIHRPETMSVNTADEICRAEGQRQVAGA